MSSSTAAPAPPRGGAGDAPAAPDWRWQIGKALLFYAAFQGVAGPNGLLAWYQGKLPPRQPATMQRSGEPSAANAPGQTPFSVPDPPKPFAAPNATTIALFGEHAPLDLYVFVTTEGAPTPDDITTQYSTLVAGSKGPRHAESIDFSDPDYAELLRDPVRESVLEPTTWSSSKPGKRVLAGARWRNVSLIDDKLSRHVDLSVAVPEAVRRANGSLWADIYATPMGIAPGNVKSTARVRKLLTRLYPERKEREEKSLFSRAKEDEKDESPPSPPAAKTSSGLPFFDKEVMPLITHWHPNLTLAIVKQEKESGYPIGKLPPPLLQWVHVAEEDGEVMLMDGVNTAGNYPIIFANDFWHLREHMHPINATHTLLPLHVNLYSTSYFKFQVLALMSDSFEKQPGMASGEVDLIKQTLLETSPWYLGITVAVSILHSIFEFLAFSSDVTHWRKKDNMAGVSLGTILTNVVVQLIILLYLLDQSQDTSWMILASQAVSIVIEAWKVTKAVDVSIVTRKRGEGLQWLQWSPYRVDIRDKHVLSETEKKTQEYDKLAFRIVACFAIPLLGGYTIYSALYQTHKGWWSFIIGTLCSFVYMFSFSTLIPQLIVNYKLKSTAGMSSKTFVYKILGTFVDDFFAFAIKMPVLHRLACFRDDIVFFVFLYQRWIYGVDNTRANEFNQVVEPNEGAENEIKAPADGPAESKKTK